MPRCLVCGYERGDIEPCPECGSTERDMTTHTDRRRDARVILGLTAIWSGLVSLPFAVFLVLARSLIGQDDASLFCGAFFVGIGVAIFGLAVARWKTPFLLAALPAMVGGGILIFTVASAIKLGVRLVS